MRQAGRLLLVPLVLLSTAIGVPVHAAPPQDWPAGVWPACADAQAQYCVESATVSTSTVKESPLTDHGMSAGVSTLDGVVNSFNWTINGLEADGVPKDVRDGYYALTVRTGQFHPRYTMALAKNLRMTTHLDANSGNTTLTIAGNVTHIDWTTGPLFATCISGSDCGGADTQADAIGTGLRFMGNTQDLGTWGDDYVKALDGFYFAGNAEARPTVVSFVTYPEPYWYLPYLGNPHLDVDGQPVRGAFNAFIPGAYFTNIGTTATEAAKIGFDVQGVDTATGTATPIPVQVYEQDGGVMLDVPDLSYSIQRINVYNRPSTAVDDTVPGRPRNVQAVVSKTGVDVSWTAPADDGGATISGYKARVYTAAAGGTLAGECAADAPTTHCTVEDVPAGVELHAAVSAVNKVGEGPASDPRTQFRRTATPPPVSSAPGAPTKVTAAGGDSRITVGWSAPADPGTSPLKSYLVQSQPGGATCEAPAGTLTCELANLTNGTEYRVTVTARSDAGDSPMSDPAVLATPSAPPKLPDVTPVGDGPIDSGTGTTFTPQKRTTTLTGHGFAPNSQVTIGIYSTPETLVTAMSDNNGDVNVEVTIPAGYAGGHTLAISGIAPGGAPHVLTLPVTVAAAAPAAPAPVSHLPVTGNPIAPIVVLGLLCLLAGLMLFKGSARPANNGRLTIRCR